MTLAGGAMGLINALDNLGGFVGPYIGGYLQDASGGSFLSTAIVLAVALLAGGLLAGGLVILTLRRQADKPVRGAQPARPQIAATRAAAVRRGHGGRIPGTTPERPATETPSRGRSQTAGIALGN
ncbi:MAG: hypothetical protein ACRDPY_40745 [Streptosporangiaceae bacterium]